MPIRIPIHFFNDQLQPVTRPHEGRPMALVGMVGTPTTAGGNVLFDQHWALIDTGADLNYAETTFLDRLGAPRIAAGDVIGATGRAPSYKRSMTLILGPLASATGVATDVMELDSSHHDSAKPYQVILGNLFLECGVLHMDHVLREYWFDYHAAMPANPT